MNNFNQSKRNFLITSLAFGGALVLETLKPAWAFPACAPSPPETEGPFYPVAFPLDKNNDLTFLEGKSRRAEGDIVYVTGRVQDEACRPVPGAMIEIWQACSTGKYNHPGDKNPARLDPNFQYWGKTLSDEKGEYGFKTVKPGSYPVDWLWTRPPHIHFNVRSKNHSELTTQMYFSGEALNNKDRLLGEHPEGEQEKFIVDFHRVGGKDVGLFNLTLKQT